MSGIKILRGEFKEKLDLFLDPQIKAGFPSPAEDYLQDSIDFYRDKRTFFSKDLPDMYKKRGNRRMESNGIFCVCCEVLR